MHEYVSAEERNEGHCSHAVCNCFKYTRGMYRYTLWSSGEEDYFSEDDPTVECQPRPLPEGWDQCYDVKKRKQVYFKEDGSLEQLEDPNMGQLSGPLPQNRAKKAKKRGGAGADAVRR